MRTIIVPSGGVSTRGRRSRWLTLSGAAVAAALTLGTLVPGASPAVADSAPAGPADPRTPATVSADVLPTPQIGDGLSDGLNDTKGSGVVWDQVVIGETVYVAGNFQNARPAGAKKGEGVVARSNFLAYDLTTGALLDVAPVFNGQIRSLAASPDGTRLYVGGSFTQVDGVNRYRAAAFDVATGSLVSSFAPSLNATVNTVMATNSTVYLGGNFTSAGKAPRSGLAAFSPADGALSVWAPVAAGGSPMSMVISPDESKIVVAGSFTTLNGSTKPGRGMGAVPASGAGTTVLTWNAGLSIRNGGSGSYIKDLASDGENVYGVGSNFGQVIDTFTEGTFAARWSDGAVVWNADCHGDTYSVAVSDQAVYTTSHAHDCARLGTGGFGEGTSTATSSDTRHRALAFSKATTGTLKPWAGKSYTNFGGQPSPSLLDWYPELTAGGFTGTSQAAWDVATADDYVLLAGEFTGVNGSTQRGLARFATRDTAPNKVGPSLAGGDMKPTVTNLGSNTVKLTWSSNYDRDNTNLIYQVIRDGNLDKPVFQSTEASSFWQRSILRGFESSLVTGKTYTYQIRTVDPFGNATISDSVTYTPSGAAGSDMTPYDKTVLQDQPDLYLPMNERGAKTATDWVADNSLMTISAREDGVESDVTGLAATFNGVNQYAVTQALPALQSYSSELWFKTTTRSGGVLMAMGSERRPRGQNDRHVYLDDSGRVWAANWDTAKKTMRSVSSKKSYNDGRWHHVVNTLGPEGMSLYVDGVLIGSRPDVRDAYPYSKTSAYWLVGGQTMVGQPSVPTSTHLKGAIDNFAVYSRVLNPRTVSAHYTAGVTTPNVEPVAAFTVNPTQRTVSVDASGSADPDGAIASYAWDFGDGSTGAGAKASHAFAKDGTFTVTLTVTDDRGGRSTLSKIVTIALPAPAGLVARDDFERSVDSGWGSATVGGAWTAGGANTSVVDGTGTLTSGKAQTSSASLPKGAEATTDTRATFRLDTAPTGGGQYVSVVGRQIGSQSYAARVWVQANGVLQLQVQRSGTILSTVNLTGVTYVVGEAVHMRFLVTGSGTTSLSAKAWTTGDEPADWARTVQDDTAALQAAGTVGLGLYVSATATGSSTVAFDDYSVTNAQ